MPIIYNQKGIIHIPFQFKQHAKRTPVWSKDGILTANNHRLTTHHLRTKSLLKSLERWFCEKMKTLSRHYQQ